MPDALDPLAVAARLFDAIERGDVDAVGELYADHVRVWHNTDGTEQDRDENLRVLRWLVRHTTARSYRSVRRSATTRGFVQQHVLHLHFGDGRTADVPACIVADIEAGRITRIDEYLDGAAVAAAFGQPPPA